MESKEDDRSGNKSKDSHTYIDTRTMHSRSTMAHLNDQEGDRAEREENNGHKISYESRDCTWEENENGNHTARQKTSS